MHQFKGLRNTQIRGKKCLLQQPVRTIATSEQTENHSDASENRQLTLMGKIHCNNDNDNNYNKQ